MSLLTDIQQLATDSALLHEIVHGGPTETVATEGGPVPTAANAINTLKAFNLRGEWTALGNYALKDIVTREGIAYVCLMPHQASAFDADLSAGYWAVHQGVTAQGLDGDAPAVPVGSKLYNRIHDAVSVLDYVPLAERAAIVARTSTADHLAAFQAAVDTGRAVYAPAGLYNVNGSLLFTSDAASGVSAFHLFGDGPDATIINQLDPDADTIVVQHSDTTRQYCMRPIMHGFSITCHGATRANEGAAIRLRQTLNASFYDITIDGPTYGIIGERIAQNWFNRVYFRTALRAAGEKAAAFFLLTHDPDLNLGTSFGNFVANCESQTGRGVERTFDLRAVDGLKIVNCHFDFAEHHIYINPDTTGGQTTVRHVLAANTYFDNNDAVPLQYMIYVKAQGSGAATVFGLLFSNCVFRGPTTCFRVAGSETEGAGLSSLKQIAFTGCEFRSFAAGVLNLDMHASYDERTIIEDVKLTGCIIDDTNTGTPNSNGAVLRGRNISLIGNTWKGNWTDDGSSVITVGSEAENVLIVGETFDTARTTSNITISTSATNVRSYGHIQTGATTNTVNEVVSQGTNANGSWVRYADGRQVVTKKFTLTDQDVSTAFGSVFHSANLMTGQTVMAQPFIDVPVFSINARITDAASWTLVAGAGTATDFPNTVYVGRGTAATGKTIIVDLRAEGRWK